MLASLPGEMGLPLQMSVVDCERSTGQQMSACDAPPSGRARRKPEVQTRPLSQSAKPPVDVVFFGLQRPPSPCVVQPGASVAASAAARPSETSEKESRFIAPEPSTSPSRTEGNFAKG